MKCKNNNDTNLLVSDHPKQKIPSRQKGLNDFIADINSVSNLGWVEQKYPLYPNERRL